MRMAATLQRSLASAHARFDLVPHPHSATSLESARVANIPAERLAKTVILDDRQGHFLMAVVPASRHLDVGKVRKDARLWQLTHEADLARLFKDCELGAVPEAVLRRAADPATYTGLSERLAREMAATARRAIGD